MNIVFVHPNFPGQFRYLAELFGKDEKNKTMFITSDTANKESEIKGVKKIIIAEKPTNEDEPPKPLKRPPAVPVANLLASLKEQNFTPDLIIGHSGNGMTLHVKDVFPQTPFLSFFEWFHSPTKLQKDFESENEPDLQVRMNLRGRNIPILVDLNACDKGVCPTQWQKKQFPDEYSAKLDIIHNGVDTELFEPAESTGFKTNELDLSEAKQIITYTANLLAPYMGFSQFMEAIPMVLEQRPDTHVVIVGFDRVSFGDNEGNKKSYKSVIMEKVDLNPEKVHFLDTLPFEDYKALLQASAAHVYLDSPLAVSPPLLEAMSCGCLLIAPDTPPIREVITDGSNGFLVDFSSPETITEKLIGCLDFPSFLESVKEKSRQTIVDDFSLKQTISKQAKIIKQMIKNEGSKEFG